MDDDDKRVAGVQRYPGEDDAQKDGDEQDVGQDLDEETDGFDAYPPSRFAFS